MANVSIEDDIYKTISKIAKKENTTENKVTNELLEKIIKEKHEKNRKDNKFRSLIGKYSADKPFSATEDNKKLVNGEPLEL